MPSDLPPSATPSSIGEPTAVGFVKTRLPQIHDAFKSLPSYYEPTLKRFILNPHPAAMPPSCQNAPLSTSPDVGQAGRVLQESQTPIASNRARRVPARQVLPALCAMRFWSEILNDAMTQFTEQNPDAPKRISKEPEHGIRGAASWDDIYAKLQRARERFDGEHSQGRKGAKKAYRYVISSSDAIRRGVQAIPDMEYLSPVKAGMEILLDAAKTATEVRTKVAVSFQEKDLTESFGKIELFLATFPGDENIRTASVDLIACTLKAVELAISYYMSRTFERFRRSLPLVGDGSGFEEGLITTINEITVKCLKIKENALESHIHETKEAMELILSGIESVDAMSNAIYEMMIDREDRLMEKVEKLANIVLDLFNQGEKTKEAARAEEIRMWQAMTERFAKRFESPDFGIRFIAALPPPQQQQQLPWHPPQGQPPWSQPTQQPAWQVQPPDPAQQQYANPYPYQYQQQSLWMAAPPPPPGYYHPPPPPLEPILCISQLLWTLGISSPDADDLASVLGSEESVSLRYRSRAKGIMLTGEFRAWATSETSCALLVLGDVTRDTTGPSAALSFFSASMMRSLRGQDRYLSLVFFCRRHLEAGDPHRGPGAMLRAFVAQLLLQLKQMQNGMEPIIDALRDGPFTQRDLEVGLNDPGLDCLRRWNTDKLCELFNWLVRRVVPPHKTLICVGDGIEAYEASQHMENLHKVAGCLLGLTRASGDRPTVKFMATSPEGTATLEGVFRGHGSAIVEMETLDSRGEDDDMLEFEDRL
ncbi:hypothetical protein GGTG_02207 [Gaeumannomyces tritici R3-111a-1]|uniref:Uncharacterized protein n=1 Tax=Gaeumannomyces tritici (strain R3-111a-1) TaxID=644352 RepID=J3NLQ7_GAET3|nr:hypothetical protein GGTG_02207 [Gaeumannomyces tritici R3-111a-1]EJT82233.1 hypothetical protein GGTG_02207 [Gaeumannomyces tritici R3-111a-1]